MNLDIFIANSWPLWRLVILTFICKNKWIKFRNSSEVRVKPLTFPTIPLPRVNKIILCHFLNPLITYFQTVSEFKQEGLRVSSFLLHCFQSSLCYDLMFKEALLGGKKHGLHQSDLVMGEAWYLLRLPSSSKGLLSPYGSVAKVITATAGWELSQF